MTVTRYAPAAWTDKQIVAFGDASGVFYWVGTSAGTAAFVNPHTALQQANFTTLGGYPVSNATDRSGPSFFSSGSEQNQWIRVRMPGGNKLRLTGYTVKARDEAGGAKIRNWKMQGSNDGVTWTDLDSRVSDATQGTGQTVYWQTPASTQFFEYIRILQNGLNSDPNYYLQLAEWELYGEYGVPSSGVARTSPAASATLTTAFAASRRTRAAAVVSATVTAAHATPVRGRSAAAVSATVTAAHVSATVTTDSPVLVSAAGTAATVAVAATRRQRSRSASSATVTAATVTPVRTRTVTTSATAASTSTLVVVLAVSGQTFGTGAAATVTSVYAQLVRVRERDAWVACATTASASQVRARTVTSSATVIVTTGGQVRGGTPRELNYTLGAPRIAQRVGKAHL